MVRDWRDWAMSVLVVGEVGEDVGAEVVGDDGDVVVGAEGLEEAVRRRSACRG